MSKALRIQYASDLHLELWKKKTFDETLEPVAPILALLGDISILTAANLHSFLEYCSERWTHIFWIPGNEVWPDLSSSVRKMKQLSMPFRNIHLLYNETFLLEDTLFVGLSLWHKPRDGMLQYNSNIYIKQIPLPVEEKIFKQAHNENVAFLRNTIKNAENPIVVLSYYAPFSWLYEEDWIQEPSYAIVDSELEALITYPIIAWLCGHNHLPIEYNRRYFLATGYQGNVLFVSNPRGRPFTKDEKEKEKITYYRKEAVLRLQPSLLDGFEPKEEEPIHAWARRS